MSSPLIPNRMSTISVSRPGPDTISLAQPERETISLSMPAIMRNPRVSLAHLHGNKARKASTKAEGKVGKGGVDKREGGQWGGRRAQNRLANCTLTRSGRATTAVADALDASEVCGQSVHHSSDAP